MLDASLLDDDGEELLYPPHQRYVEVGVELGAGDVPLLLRAGVNPVTAAGPGCVDLHGGVTTARGSGLATEWCDLHLRRMTLFVVSGIVQKSRWLIFSGEMSEGVAELRAQLEAFLSVLQAQGALAGISPREGWFLRDPVVNGERLELEFGIALRRPREFLHFRIIHHGGATEVRELGWQPELAAAV